MSDWKVVEVDGERSRECESRAEAEEIKSDMEGLGLDVKIVQPEKTDGGVTSPAKANNVSPEVVDEDVSKTGGALAELGQELGTDPLSILPSHMVDEIQGQLAVNKRGYAMIAERYGVAVSAEIVSYPWDNSEGRCVAKAEAETEDGRTYTGHATACVEDGDMADQIIELAETRSLKRAVSWASGVGIVSYQELASQLE